MEAGTASSRISSTSRRERRCADWTPAGRDPAQVDDPLHARCLRRLGEMAGHDPVAVGEVAVAGGLHRVHEVVGGGHAVERLAEVVAGEQVGPDGLDAVERGDPRGVPGQAPDGAAFGGEALEQALSEIAGGSGDEFHGEGYAP